MPEDAWRLDPVAHDFASTELNERSGLTCEPVDEWKLVAKSPTLHQRGVAVGSIRQAAGARCEGFRYARVVVIRSRMHFGFGSPRTLAVRRHRVPVFSASQVLIRD